MRLNEIVLRIERERFGVMGRARDNYRNSFFIIGDERGYESIEEAKTIGKLSISQITEPINFYVIDEKGLVRYVFF